MAGTLAIHGGTPVRTKPWPKWPVYDNTEEQALIDTLRSGVWGVGGKRKTELEQKYAAMHNAKYAISCCNGTVALQIAMIAGGLQPGDEVITSPYTFMASGLAALTVGVVPVFVDVEPGTHNLDPTKIEAAITPRTRGILPVHIGGRPSDMDGIMLIAKKHNLIVIEDACQAWTAEWRGVPVGSIGLGGGFSFQSSKNIAAGEGGIILTNNEAMYQRCWSYHNCGRKQGGEWYDHDFPGLNYRMSEFNAAVLLAQIARLPQMQATRRESMAALHKQMQGMPGILTPTDDARVTAHGCHIYMLRLDRKELSVDKMQFIKALNAEGVPAGPGYTRALYREGFWNWYGERPTGGGTKMKDHWAIPYSEYKCPVTEELCATTIWIKQDVLLAGASEMGDIVRAFEKVSSAARAGSLVGA
ncbi:MAG: DegT/DnrJ/EryC1/StrS family aminotransferase [Acidobacteriota bacterium]